MLGGAISAEPMVLHAVWCDGALRLWGERPPAPPAPPARPSAASTPGGPAAADEGLGHAASVADLRAALAPAGIDPAWLRQGTVELRLPLRSASSLADTDTPDTGTPDTGTPDAPETPGTRRADAEASAELAPCLSDAMAHALGLDAPAGEVLETFTAPCLSVDPAWARRALGRIEESQDDAGGWDAGPAGPDGASRRVIVSGEARFWMAAGRAVRWLLSEQRIVPSVMQEVGGGVRGLWQPWLADEGTLERVRALLAAMPGAARCGVDRLEHAAWPVLDDFLTRACDAECRQVLLRETMGETIEGRDPGADPHVAWLTGLLAAAPQVRAGPERRTEVIRRVRSWVGVLDQRGAEGGWRLCLRLSEPLDLGLPEDLAAPGPGLTWPLAFLLQSTEDHDVLVEASEVWGMPTGGAVVAGSGRAGRSVRLDRPQETLLAEIGRAARLYKPVEDALAQGEPSRVSLGTAAAYEFLREHRSVLIEQGFGVVVPRWWDTPSARIGVRLAIDSGELPALTPAPGAAAPSRVGLHTLVGYQWQISLGDTTLSLAEFEKLAATRSPLVMVGGRWVEVRPEDLRHAMEFIRQNPGGRIELGRALRLAYAADVRQTGLPVLGLDVSGWASALLGGAPQGAPAGAGGAQGAAGGASAGGEGLGSGVPILEQPKGFVGSLRPYQIKGLSWMAFLDRIGLGACLADDMGLGKTIQFLALLAHEHAEHRERQGQPGADPAQPPGPTLLVVPMSVVGNWVRETRRFAPDLRVLVHHGADRLTGRELFESAAAHELVVTTYSLAHRDRDDLAQVPWGRVALDEAQNIKNPAAKQAQAIRAIDAPRRVALTGTPIENRLSELWSIMDFLNPGVLGSVHEFRTRFAAPIERYRDQHRASQLRSLVRPFVLRRLKTDPTVIADLPEKVETKEFCYLTPEQAQLYEVTVRRMLAEAERAEGIARRGAILAGLVRLKQICDHPALIELLPAQGPAPDRAALAPDEPEDAPAQGQAAHAQARPGRSGKCVRLVEMLDEVLASGGRAVVFTQFRTMAELLSGMLRRELDREVLLLHGGTPAQARDEMVARFQRGDPRCPVFVLSLKAGGVGLNLTAANHVFHFDRWWNPAVENQATDRAFRIGQTRSVQVHKFVVSGTLEERIDQMIELKSDLAENVIGSGEAWLTELNLSQLRDVLMLRPGAVEADPAESDTPGDADRAAGATA
ncbi:MAG: ATP-dependent helicase [Planctomyces sp.]|nr:ATP-dependent helicase [Planctomyces sp.]